MDEVIGMVIYIVTLVLICNRLVHCQYLHMIRTNFWQIP